MLDYPSHFFPGIFCSGLSFICSRDHLSTVRSSAGKIPPLFPIKVILGAARSSRAYSEVTPYRLIFGRFGLIFFPLLTSLVVFLRLSFKAAGVGSLARLKL